MSMTPGIRKFTLTWHITISVGLLGSIAAFLALSIAGLNSQDDQTIRASYLAMDSVSRFIIMPLAFASLLTGLIQSLGTPWGLFRNYWVLTKLLITAFATAILLIKLKMISYAAQLASEVLLPFAELSTVGMELRFHAAAGLLVLLVPTVLSVYKPRGLTPYGWRKYREKMGESQSPDISRQTIPVSNDGVSASSGGSVTVTFRYKQLLGLAVTVLIVHLLVLHVSGVGFVGH